MRKKINRIIKYFIFNDDALATNPGNVKVNPFVWFFHDTLTIISMIPPLGYSIRLARLSGWFIILVLLLGSIGVAYWLRVKAHFKNGDSNVGKVIALNPTLVAVTTNLTKGFGDYPVVKIIDCRKLKEVELGERIATVALYAASTDESLHHWIDFEPIPLAFATKDKKTLENALQSYGNQQWEDLNTRLQEIKKPYQPGLYKVEIETSHWKNTTTQINM